MLLLLRMLFCRQKFIGCLVRRLVQTYTLNVDGNIIRVLLVHF